VLAQPLLQPEGDFRYGSGTNIQDDICQAFIDGAPRSEQRFPAGHRITLQQWPCRVPGNPVRNCGSVTFQVNHSAIFEQLLRPGIQNGATTQGYDGLVLFGGFYGLCHSPGFDFPEGVLSPSGENISNTAVGGDHICVGIHERYVQLLCQLLANG
jgi:hypothetical protein